MKASARLICLLVCGVLASPLQAQLVVKLKPETVAEFEQYAQNVETQLNERWQGKKSFLSIQDQPDVEKRVLGGEIFIKQMSGGNPVPITNGLIHDWMGAVFIPDTRMERVLNILQDFDNHKNIYPEVADSKTIHRTANDVTGYWRLQQKGMVPVVLNVEQDAHYTELAPGKWKCEAYARKITEIDMSLFTRGRKFPLGEGHGYLWRLYAYWSLEKYNGGVLAECRTLSLSRDIPQGLAWAVGPYVNKAPEDSITSTLRETRRAASSHDKVQ